MILLVGVFVLMLIVCFPLDLTFVSYFYYLLVWICVCYFVLVCD